VVTEEDGGLVMTTEFTGVPAEIVPEGPPPPVLMHPIDDERFAVVIDDRDDAVVFLDFERGHPRYLVVGGRVARRRK
jgi:hypothetical protein